MIFEVSLHRSRSNWWFLKNTNAKPRIQTYASATRYVVDVDAGRAGLLFLADANYPGWQASIDDKPVAVFSAQALGKAVAVAHGRHTVEISFHSASFRYGSMITILSLFAALVFFACALRCPGLFVSTQS